MSDRDEPTIDEAAFGLDDDPFDALAEAFAERCRRGDPPSISDYAAEHPDLADRIRKLFPAIARLEQLGRDDRASGQRSSAAPLPPTRLGDFRIVGELGRGGMGVVYDAVQESLGRRVALKVLHHAQVDAKRLQRFRREALAVAKLHHTNIVPIFGVGDHEGVPYYAMQSIRGQGLNALISGWREECAPPAAERGVIASKIIVQAARALGYAHDQGVLHRDVKPANLLLDQQDAVWVTDFGLAKLAGQDDLTNTGDVIGTLRYLAPEALRGESGPVADVYGLGLTLYELITLQPPFGLELSASELLRQVSEGEPPAPRTVDPQIHRDLETIVLKSIAREPAHRYQSAEALADDLARFLEDRPILARRATPPEKLWRWARRNRIVAATSAIAVGSLFLAAIIGWAGYVITREAYNVAVTKKKMAESATKRAESETKRANKNVSLSLQVFGELFETLSPSVDFLPPPTGRVRHGRSFPDLRGPGPGGFGPFSLGEPGRGPRGEGPNRGFPGPPPEGFPPGGPGGPDAMRGPAEARSPARDAELLASILTFYETFASENADDDRLKAEAARAYFRVGVLREAMGLHDQAEAAYKQAIARFEERIRQDPDDFESRNGLVRLFIMADPWTADESRLEMMVKRLRRANQLLDEARGSAADDAEAHRSRIHVEAKLAASLHRLGRLEEAERGERRAIEATGKFLDRFPDDPRALLDRSDVREELCRLRMERGATDEARALLEPARHDLMAAARGDLRALPIVDRIRGLAQLHQELGDTAHAEELRALVVDAEFRRHPDDRHRPTGSPGLRP